MDYKNLLENHELDIRYMAFFDKKYIDYNGKKVEVLDFNCADLAYLFNKNGEELAQPVSVKPDLIASKMRNDKNEKLDTIACLFNTISCFQTYDTTNYDKIIRDLNRVFKTRYWARDSFCRLTLVKDETLLDAIEKQLGNHKSDVGIQGLEELPDISEVYDRITRKVIGQDEPVKEILTSVYKNQLISNLKLGSDLSSKLRENIFIFGSTGTGRKETLKQVAKELNIPMIIKNGKAMSGSNNCGESAIDVLNELYMASGENLTLAQRGIIVFDSFYESVANDDISFKRKTFQNDMAQLFNGTPLIVNGKKFNTSQLTIAAISDENVAIKYFEKGLSFSKVIDMNSIGHDDLKKIATESEISPINTYKELFGKMGIALTYDDTFIDWLVSRASEYKQGALGLKLVFDDYISGAMFEILTDKNVDFTTQVPCQKYSEIHLKGPTEDDEKKYQLIKK